MESVKRKARAPKTDQKCGTCPSIPPQEPQIENRNRVCVP